MRRIGMVLVAIVVAAVVVNKDRLMARLRGATSSPITQPTTHAAPEGAPATAPKDAPKGPKAMTLPGLRKALKTTIGEGQRDETPAPEPPAGELEKVYYDAPLGKNVAYVTPAKPGARGPAIVWIHGGFDWGIDDSAWAPSPRDNDQSAANFRKAGIAEMYPALRGGSQNPGHRECFLGEIDDVLAAAEFLARRPDVDPQRIYLGGHSTGALIVLLAVESTARFRAAFAFGPVADPRQYGESSCIKQGAPAAEIKARSAIEFLSEIVTPTFLIEGAKGNAAVFPMMQKRIAGAPVSFVTVPDADHFTALAPACDVVARAILADTGDKPAIRITAGDITAAMHN